MRELSHEEIETARSKVRGKAGTDKGRSRFKRLKRIRYALFRVQNQIGGGCDAEGAHHRIANKYKDDVADLGGLAGFAKSWDVDPENPTKVIKRGKSIWQAHNEMLARALPVLDAQLQEAPRKSLSRAFRHDDDSKC